MAIRSFSDSALLSNFKILVQQERRVSRDVLEHIAEIESRRLFAEEGCTSTHDWLVKFHGYSHASAGRRVSAARLLSAVPAAAAKIETGELCMSTLSRVQSSIRTEEKRTGKVSTPHYKTAILEQIEAKPKSELEQTLAEIFQVHAPKRDVVETMCSGERRVHLTFTDAQMTKIERAAELLSHKIEGGSLSDAIAEMAELVILRKDPLVKVVKPRTTKLDNAQRDRSGQDTEIEKTANVSPSNTRAISLATRNAVYRRDNGCCQFTSQNGYKCLSRKFTQIDHIVPRALGGTNHITNLRVLCRPHNQLMAERIFGREKIKRERGTAQKRTRSSRKAKAIQLP